MDNILLLTILISEELILLLSLHIIFNKKFYLNIYSLGVIGINSLILFLVNIGRIPQVFSILGYVLLWCFCFFQFKLTAGKTTIKYVVGNMIGFLIETLSTYLMLLLQNRFELDATALASRMFTPASGLLALGITYAAYRVRIMPQMPDYEKFGRSTAVVTCLYGVVLIFFIINYYYNNEKVSVYVPISLTFMFLLYFYVRRFERAEIRAEKKQLELDMQKVYGKAYEELLQNVRIRQHDFKNQLGALYSMHVVAGSLEELVSMQKEYGDRLLRQCRYDAILTCCENQVLAGYLYYRCIGCEEKGIDVAYDVHVKDAECRFAIYEIIELLGILIDNACESVLGREDGNKRIRFSCNEDSENLVIAVSNPSQYLKQSEIEKIFSSGYSTKGKNRGIGLARALELIRQKGEEIRVANLTYEGNNWIEFSVEIRK